MDSLHAAVESNPLVASIQTAIHHVRGSRVMLDADLARLYGVEVRVLNQAVKRNIQRFPVDFAFRLSADEVAGLKSQVVISSRSSHGGARRAPPMAFTEHGVAMLSSALNSERAIAVNIEIMRAFVQMRRVLMANADLAKRLTLLEAEMARHAGELGQHKAETVRALKAVFGTLKSLAREPAEAEGTGAPVGFELR